MWKSSLWMLLCGSVAIAAGPRTGPDVRAADAEDGPRVSLGSVATTTVVETVEEMPSPEYFNEAAKAAFREATSIADRPYLEDVRSRVILPRRDRRIDFSRGRAAGYIQFERALSAVERREYVLRGLRFDFPISRHTYLARFDREVLARLHTDPLFRGVEPVHPADKLSAEMYHGVVHPAARHADGSMEAFVRFHKNVSLAHALHVLDRWGVRVEDRSQLLFGERLKVLVTHGQALVLAEEPSVTTLLEIPTPAQAHNSIARIMHHVNPLHDPPYDLTGDGVIAGQWELDHALETHEQLDGRVEREQPGDTSDHATHVAGTIMGDGTGDLNAMGMAPGLDRLHTYTSAGDTAVEQAIAMDVHGIVLSNHSWGPITGWHDGNDTGSEHHFGRYDWTAHLYDGLVKLKGLLIQKSSGNDGNDCDPDDPLNCDGDLAGDGRRYDTIAEQGNAKNIITIGAIDGAKNLTGFSSCGPTNDNRIKPDLVAKGNELHSAWAGGNEPLACDGLDYCGIGGTSMSTAVMSGVVALLIQHYRQELGGHTPRPDVMKALLVNTAEDLGLYGPDYAYGHGMVDALAAAEVIDVGEVRIITDAVDSGQTDTHYLIVPPGVPQLRVTASWLDTPGQPVSSNPDLVNDLDLSLIAPDESVFFPFSGSTGADDAPSTNNARNSVDNVEVVWVESPPSGIYLVRVHGRDVPDGPQGYAVVAGAPFYRDDEPEIEVSANLVFDEHCPDEVATEKEVTIYNVGGDVLLVHGVEVTEGAPEFSMAPDPSPPFILQPGTHISLWVLFAPDSDGPKTGNLRIFSNDVDEGTLDLPLEGTGGYGMMLATSQSLKFNPTPLGENDTREFEVINQGTCNLVIEEVEVVTGDTDISLNDVNTLPATIFPGEQLNLFFSYEPLDYGVHETTFQITNDAGPSVTFFTFRGSCPPPRISTTGSLDFGEVCLGSFVDQELNICNTGVSSLEVDSVELDAGCGEFSIVNNPFPATLAGGSCLPITVRYTPVDLGDDDCTLTIDSDDPDHPTVELAATGTSPAPILTTSGSLDFGEICATETPEQELNICNTGRCDLVVTEVVFNPPCDDFEIVNNPFPATVSHDFCLPLTIRATPTGAGEHICFLEIHSNDPVTPIFVLPVTSTVLETSADVPPDVAFPPTVIQDVAACASYRPFPVTNIGECPMTITDFEIVQAGADYTVALLPTLPITLMPGEVLGEGALMLVFSPIEVARHSTAEVRVTYVTNFPAMGDTETETRRLCGEATRTGVRVLVTEDDLPVAEVMRMEFFRVYYPDTVDETLGVITLENDLPLTTVPEDPPCGAFQYHREWGAVTDPLILEPGTYRVIVKIITSDGLQETRDAQFDLDLCDFTGDLRIDF